MSTERTEIKRLWDDELTDSDPAKRARIEAVSGPEITLVPLETEPPLQQSINDIPSIPPQQQNGAGSSRQSDQEETSHPHWHDLPKPISRLGLKPIMPTMPASLEVVTGVKTDMREKKGFVGQEEVGIIGYAGMKGSKGVKGVIKQRLAS